VRSHLGFQPRSRAMQSDARSCGRTLENLSDLRSAQAIPAGEHEKFAIIVIQGLEAKLHDHGLLVEGVNAGKVLIELLSQPGHEVVSALKPPTVIGQDISSSHEEPQETRVAVWDFLEPPPSDLERLGDNIRSVLS
jgi:hypothetical protein